MVATFPDRDPFARLVEAVLAEQHDEWIEGRRYINLGALSASQDVGTTEPDSHADPKEVKGTDPATLAT